MNRTAVDPPSALQDLQASIISRKIKCLWNTSRALLVDKNHSDRGHFWWILLSASLVRGKFAAIR